jgi:hypothetical protein
MREIVGVSPVLKFGLSGGVSEKTIKEITRRHVDFIATDAGSIDPGPYYLGSGEPFYPRTNVKKETEQLLSVALLKGIPLLISSAGFSGGKPHLAWMVDIVRESAAEKGLKFKMAVINAEQDKDFVKERLRQGKIHPLSVEQQLTEQDVDESSRIVAMMGVEPFIKALDEGSNVVIAGRALDAAPFAALPIKEGIDPGLAIHMGKILECGTLCAANSEPDVGIVGSMRRDHFVLQGIEDHIICTPSSVALESMYERRDPYRIACPGGYLDLSATKFEPVDDRSVKVSGSKFVRDDTYTLKLEGSALVGYRTICIAGVRCPRIIASIDSIVEGVRTAVKRKFPGDDYRLFFRIYGKNGVMGDLEPEKATRSHELGIVIDAVGKTQELANSVCSVARGVMTHYHFEGILSTAGNLAFPFSPFLHHLGPVYQFSVHHKMEVDDPCELFPVSIETVGG